MSIIEYKGKKPEIGKNVFIAPGAFVIGEAVIGDNASIWFNAVVRADINSIVIGDNTNIQDNSVLHVDNPPHNLVIGRNVTVGHGAVLHACVIEEGCLIGMGATVLSRAVIGAFSIIGANSLVKEGQVIPPNSLAVGSPAKVIREITPEEKEKLLGSAEHYAAYAKGFLDHAE